MADPKAMVKPGVLYGVGVGPGDPELITVKVWRLISMTQVIAYLAANGKDSTARDIARPFIPDDAEHLVIDMPMRSEREAGEKAYDFGAAAISVHLKAGRDVVFLCEGDPFFYGSFMYLHARLAKDFETVVVPGVTSITASAAAIGRPLSARNEVVKILPAMLPEDRLRDELLGAESAAIVKVGRHFPKIRTILGLLNLASRARIVIKATHEDQRTVALNDFDGDTLPYFSTILVYAGSEPW
jgi:precorrin-2/cobalt-factor-2 C20-methyltransferase